ncbi:DUF6161 domain-containing protein [Sphingobacterium mizutaii]|uniref:DUF6161 domain-containing protein n=1 Tax=Sphingobacterium mizutaii TaxID=1010 RepID=UPI0016288958|nr:DUF6161 domain-containing protein [Sphingobacterium mizutaii]
MTLKEVREIISDSEISEIINQYTLHIVFPSNGEKLDFTGFVNVYKFIKKQKDEWAAVEQAKTYPNFRQSKAFFDNTYSQIIGLLNNVKNKSINKTNIAQSLSNLTQSLRPNNQTFTFDAPEVDFLFGLHDRYPKSFDSAFQYLISGSVALSNKDQAQGVFLAYEFQNKDISHIFNRRETEKKSLFELRRSIDKTANEYENTLIAHLKKSTEDYKEYKSNLDDFQQRSEDSLSQWMITHKGEFEGFHKESIDKISALENQYAELLKLKEPVEYWKEKAKGLRTTGYWAFGVSSIGMLILAFSIYRLLWHTPEGLLESLFDGDRTAAIRWSIVFVIFISCFFVIIRAIMKFMFSNFHLARDAEEREKLTYLYLALISNGQFNEDERKIVMQSLFSRSDTGLLKEDSSPTMPGINSLFGKN